MSAAGQLAAAAAAFIELRLVPFTRPGSRLLVRRTTSGLSVCRAEYEVDADDAVAVASLRLWDGAAELPVSAVHVDRIEFGEGTASLTFADRRALSIGARSPVRLRLELPDGTGFDREVGGAHGSVRLLVEDDRSVAIHAEDAHAGHLGRARDAWLEWFARCPSVRADLQPMAAHCWWVLGANQVELASVPGSRAVVPAKLGYVALWQWDAYFIAVGLRHGDLDLAAEQLALAFRFQSADGQLPDLLHDTGVLAGSDDLPSADLARLRELGSPAAGAEVRVPLTKPPLAALALARLADAGLDPERVRSLLPAVQRSQQWWFDHCVAADGLPEYGHPYSSGLDDSPVFDADLPVATPDLAAYLEVQDLVLADVLAELGYRDAAIAHRQRADDTRILLMRLWDRAGRRFAPRGRRGRVAAHTVLDLLPLLTGRLPMDVVAALVADLVDPGGFAAPHPVPSVALNDPAFDPERMWRGPTWLNTNWLLIEGLLRSGHDELATELAECTLAMVVAAGGAYEYFNPLTGTRPPRAAAAFGWTAALFLDLAVRFAPAGLDRASALEQDAEYNIQCARTPGGMVEQ